MPNAPRAAAASVDVGTGVAGRARLALSDPSGGRAELYTHGGQVLSWRPPTGDDVLFLSANTGDRQIAHGGVPIVFPQFGGGALPQHGFARTSDWSVGAQSASERDGARATVALAASAATRALWPHEFRLALTVALGRTLAMTLVATNAGAEQFTFTVGFHTYFRVRDVRRTSVTGLSGLTFRDKTRDYAESVDKEPAIVARGETDRVYLGAPRRVTIDDGERTIGVEASGFGNIVVWNPGPEGDARFGFADGEWSRFICVEPATITEPVTLKPGEAWSAAQTLSVENSRP